MLTGHVHGHFFDLGAVELFNFPHHSYVVSRNKVDCNAFSPESSTTANAMDVVLAVGRKVVVDDQRDLLDVDTTSEQVSCDEDTRRS